MIWDDLVGPLLQFLFETAIDSLISSKAGERRYGCGCCVICCLLMLLIVGLAVAASR